MALLRLLERFRWEELGSGARKMFRVLPLDFLKDLLRGFQLFWRVIEQRRLELCESECEGRPVSAAELATRCPT